MYLIRFAQNSGQTDVDGWPLTTSATDHKYRSANATESFLPIDLLRAGGHLFPRDWIRSTAVIKFRAR